MKKTGGTIETDIYKLIAASLKTGINGQVYNSAGRPTDSQKEDAVIIFMTGTDGQVQEGIVTVNIYVPKLQSESGRKIKDTAKCRTLEEFLQTTIDALRSTEYDLSRKSIIKTFDEETIDQNFVNAQIYFRRITK